jgi:hypothetical protein
MKRFAVPVLVLLACSAPEAAASGFANPAAGARLSPGHSALAAFELPRGSDFPRIGEMELVLSLDGGATFPLRLTGELSPGTRRVWWRVPALPTSRAVLGLRVGNDDGDERLVLVTGLFTILGESSTVLDDIRFAHGEWRTREAGFDGVFPFSGGSLSGESPEGLFAATTRGDFAETRPLQALEQSRSGPRTATAAALSFLLSGSSPVPRVPALLPRRE